ncbi:MAG TPA: hypothetical protein VFZ56_01960 [Gemmatimonadaceae bacterium]
MTGTASRPAGAESDTATQARLVGFFRTEALRHGEQLVAELAATPTPAPAELARALSHARVIRGSAAMAGLIEISAVAGHLERILKSLHARRLAWTAVLADTVRTAASGLLDLIEAIPAWTGELEMRARALTAELGRYDVGRRPAEQEVIVPIGRLFHSDSGPHVLFVPATPQTEFEQQLRALARHTGPGGPLATPPRAASGAPSPPSTPQRARTRTRTPTAPRGSELRALLDTSVSRMDASFGGQTADTVPIDQLQYSGAAALQRARSLARIIRSRGAENSRELLRELMDLLELAGG